MDIKIELNKNPLKLHDSPSLDLVEKRLMKLVDEFAQLEKLTDKDKELLKKTIHISFQKKRIQLSLNSRLQTFCNRVDNVISCLSISEDCPEQIYVKDFAYIRNTKHAHFV